MVGVFWSKVLLVLSEEETDPSSDNTKRQLAFELKNSLVFEKRSKRVTIKRASTFCTQHSYLYEAKHFWPQPLTCCVKILCMKDNYIWQGEIIVCKLFNF